MTLVMWNCRANRLIWINVEWRILAEINAPKIQSVKPISCFGFLKSNKPEIGSTDRKIDPSINYIVNDTKFNWYVELWMLPKQCYLMISNESQKTICHSDNFQNRFTYKNAQYHISHGLYLSLFRSEVNQTNWHTLTHTHTHIHKLQLYFDQWKWIWCRLFELNLFGKCTNLCKPFDVSQQNKLFTKMI